MQREAKKKISALLKNNPELNNIVELSSHNIRFISSGNVLKFNKPADITMTNVARAILKQDSLESYLKDYRYGEPNGPGTAMEGIKRIVEHFFPLAGLKEKDGPDSVLGVLKKPTNGQTKVGI